MELFAALRKRRSIRQYRATKIPRRALEKIVDAGRFAATARGVQPWEFVVVTQEQVLRELADITDHGKFLAGAAACIAVFSMDTKYYLEDGSAATQNILLAATGLGIGSCWIAGDKKPYGARIGELLGVPASHKLVSLVALGYPLAAGMFRQTEKRPLQQLLHWERF